MAIALGMFLVGCNEETEETVEGREKEEPEEVVMPDEFIYFTVPAGENPPPPEEAGADYAVFIERDDLLEGLDFAAFTIIHAPVID